MRAIRFRLPADEKEELLDALLPLLPAGVRELERGDGDQLDLVAALQLADARREQRQQRIEQLLLLVRREPEADRFHRCVPP